MRVTHTDDTTSNSLQPLVQRGEHLAVEFVWVEVHSSRPFKKKAGFSPPAGVSIGRPNRKRHRGQKHADPVTPLRYVRVTSALAPARARALYWNAATIARDLGDRDSTNRADAHLTACDAEEAQHLTQHAADRRRRNATRRAPVPSTVRAKRLGHSPRLLVSQVLAIGSDKRASLRPPCPRGMTTQRQRS